MLKRVRPQSQTPRYPSSRKVRLVVDTVGQCVHLFLTAPNPAQWGHLDEPGRCKVFMIPVRNIGEEVARAKSRGVPVQTHR